MPINSQVFRNISTTEYQKFVEIFNDSRFPPMTTNPPGYDGVPTTQIFPKYALLTYDIGQNSPPIPVNTLPFGNNSTTDAFGRLRVSQAETIHNCKQIYDNAPLIYNGATVNNGVTRYDSNNASTVLQVSGVNDVAIRQTRLYTNYQPGKSQLAFITFSMPDTGDITHRVGLFTGDTTSPYANPRGFYFQSNNGVLSFNLSNFGGGESSQTVPQSAWNIDTLDGNGLSDITLDVTKTQILVMDFEWLGVGRVRFGFCIDGIVYYAHAFNNANSLVLPYLKSPNYPVRYEIRSNGGAGIQRQICSTVMSEGGSDINGIPYSCNTGVSGLGNIPANALAPVINIRLKSSQLGTIINLIDFAAMAKSTTNTLLEIRLNGSIQGGAITYSPITNSSVEFGVCSTTNTISGGTILYSSFFNKQSGTLGEISQSLFSIGSNVSGGQDVLSLCLSPNAGNETYFASLNWLELL